MKNKIFKILILSVVAIISLTLFAACGIGETERKYDHLITFNYNVGDHTKGGLADSKIYPDQFLGVMTGGKIALKPGGNESFKELVLNGYFIEGWYTAKTDEAGNPVVGDDGRVALDTKWDFEADTVSSDITLYANFVQKATLIITGGDSDLRYDQEPGTIKREPSTALQPKKIGHTFIGYYIDADYKTPFVWPFTFEAGETVVYARFMEGDWALASTADEFIRGYQGNKNIYVTADLDFTGKKWPSLPYNAEIDGNEHTLSGISTLLEFSKKNSTNLALFGTLGSKANLHDFTIANASIEMKWVMQAREDNCKLAMLAWNAEAGCKITNVTVTGTIKAKNNSMLEGSQIDFAAIDKVIAQGRENATITKCNFDGITVVLDE